MKKILAIIAAVIFLTLSLSFSALAGDYVYRESQNAAVVLENGNEIVYKGESYKKVELEDVSFYSGVSESYFSLDVVFYDEKYGSYFNGFSVSQPVDADFILFSEYETNKSFYSSETYIKEAYLEDFNAFLKDEYKGSYKTESDYGNMELFSFTTEQIEEWLNPAGIEVLDAGELDYDQYYYMDMFDETGCFYKTTGFVLRQIHYNGPDVYYYLSYENGAENKDSPGEKLVLYRLDDENLSMQLSEYYDTLPEDELDWLFNETSDTGALVLCTLFFGILPLGVIVFSVIMLAVYKNKYSKAGYIVMISASGLVIACFITLIILLGTGGVL